MFGCIQIVLGQGWGIYMGQCVSRKAGAVIATGHRDSLTYRIMDKPAKVNNLIIFNNNYKD